DDERNTERQERLVHRRVFAILDTNTDYRRGPFRAALCWIAARRGFIDVLRHLDDTLHARLQYSSAIFKLFSEPDDQHGAVRFRNCADVLPRYPEFVPCTRVDYLHFRPGTETQGPFVRL